ncbi:tRNA-modifying protein YgfZ [Buchnera aphidicola (Neophyllaphis varicolor)]|uniref:tRNA-modifying protein YgfZ n=1 Tax=Buchnera aphidicola TaxID=9 RepID=UPI0031B80F9A
MVLDTFSDLNTILKKDVPLKLFLLNELKIIKICGIDSFNYLQSQFTIDIKLLNENNYLISAHCNNKGKILSVFYIFKYLKDFYYIQPSNITNKQIFELKKYSIFSRLNIEQNSELVLIGVLGFKAVSFLEENFEIKFNKFNNSLICNKDIFVLSFKYPIKHFLIIMHVDNFNNRIQQLNKNIVSYDNSYFLSLLIRSNFPIINDKIIGKFFPQNLNLAANHGLSFDKGCYIGQEMISKINFSKSNKKSLYCLFGKYNNLYVNSNLIEKQVFGKWYIAGKILNIITVSNIYFIIQGVLDKNLVNDIKLRIYKTNILLKII